MQMGNLNIVKNIIEKGDKDNILDLMNDEIIYTACLFGDEKIIKYLLNYGVYVDDDVIEDIEYELGDDFDDNLRNLLKKYVKNNDKSHIRYNKKSKINEFKDFTKRLFNRKGFY